MKRTKFNKTAKSNKDGSVRRKYHYRKKIKDRKFPKKIVGRPEIWNPEYHLDIISKLCMLGCTDKRLCELLEISMDCFTNWKSKYPELITVLFEGRDIANATVAKGLYNRAIGYSHPDVKVFQSKTGKIVKVPITKYYPPDPVAAKMFLLNRTRYRPVEERWIGDKTVNEITGLDGTPLVGMDLSEMSPEEAMSAYKAMIKG